MLSDALHSFAISLILHDSGATVIILCFMGSLFSKLRNLSFSLCRSSFNFCNRIHGNSLSVPREELWYTNYLIRILLNAVIEWTKTHHSCPFRYHDNILVGRARARGHTSTREGLCEDTSDSVRESVWGSVCQSVKVWECMSLSALAVFERF